MRAVQNPIHRARNGPHITREITELVSLDRLHRGRTRKALLKTRCRRRHPTPKRTTDAENARSSSILGVDCTRAHQMDKAARPKTPCVKHEHDTPCFDTITGTTPMARLKTLCNVSKAAYMTETARPIPTFPVGNAPVSVKGGVYGASHLL